MKNYFHWITGLVILGITLVACSPGEAPAQAEAPAANPPESVPDLGYCKNKFYPIKEGLTLDYRASSTGETSDIRFVYLNVSDSAFTQVMTTGDITTEISWSCNPDGLLSSQNASATFAQDANLEFETIDISGIAFPPEEKWQIGYSWDTVFTMRFRSIGMETDQFEGEGVYAVTNTIVGIEAVSVPAGSYASAYRVDALGTFTMRVMGEEMEITATSSNWYVENVGMVKSASSEVDFNMELVALGES